MALNLMEITAKLLELVSNNKNLSVSLKCKKIGILEFSSPMEEVDQKKNHNKNIKKNLNFFNECSLKKRFPVI